MEDESQGVQLRAGTVVGPKAAPNESPRRLGQFEIAVSPRWGLVCIGYRRSDAREDGFGVNYISDCLVQTVYVSKDGGEPGHPLPCLVTIIIPRSKGGNGTVKGITGYWPRFKIASKRRKDLQSSEEARHFATCCLDPSSPRSSVPQ